jgi:hypothetical protein
MTSKRSRESAKKVFASSTITLTAGPSRAPSWRGWKNARAAFTTAGSISSTVT